ncbi:hypothetical protein rosag_34240 [Roseisolibacter agri]|uniref:histidine kinase n=2 Tax=Roseisolibacter agri TaxID=2014610 RepID=A0AA37QBY0_9BACT|nr:hypothetical protein rosag_34240 [Roseisolibacter agri]
MPSVAVLVAPDAPRYTVAAATDAFCAAARIPRPALAGRSLGDALGDGAIGGDASALRDALAEALRTGAPTARPRVTPVAGPDGVVSWLLVVLDDAPADVPPVAAPSGEAGYRALFEAMDQGFCIVEMLFDGDRPVDYRFVDANAAFAQQTGLVGALGRTARALVPDLEMEWVERYGHVAVTGEAGRFQSGSDAMGRWFDVFAFRVGAPQERRVAILFTDVSAMRQAEAERARLVAAVSAERERLRAIILHMPAPVALLMGPEHRHALVNAAFRRISGGGRDVTGLTVREAFPELDGQGVIERFDRVFATGEPWVGRETHIRYDRDGTGPRDTWFDVRFEPVRDASGAVIGILNFAVDVTEQVLARREVERLLAESERARDDEASARQHADAVLRSIADAFYLVDREWRFTYVNDAAEPLLQTTREALLGRTLWEAFPGVVGSPFEGPYREAMATGRHTSAEAYFPPLGTWFDVQTYAWAGGLMVHFRDIGERKAAEAERERLLQQLGIERARLEEVFRRAPSFAVVYRGPAHVYEFVNEAYYALVGRRALLGRPLDEAIPEAREQGFAALLDRVKETGEPWEGRESPVWLERTPGAPRELRYVDMVFQPLAEADGARTGVLAHGVDITEQVLARREVERLLTESERARAEAEAARREAEAANRAKADFLATMSHELRTPLNAIGGYAELMEMGIRGPVTPQQVEDLRRIQASQLHLLGLVNEVLNYARIETGTVRYQLTDVPLAAVVASVEPLVAPQLAAKGLAFAVALCDPAPVAHADREKVRQVLLNLLSNAVKFTDAPGRVEVACECGDDRVLVHVRDTGIGIAREELERVFEPFVQVNASLTRTAEGTGLGLAISRDLARGMGGDLTARSTPGVGSTFTLALPAAR